MTVSDAQLKLISPLIPAGTSVDLNQILALVGANTVNRAALVIGQLAIESDYFRVMVEDPSEYAGRAYVPYYGRSWIQLTWLDNYRACGAAINVDLVSNPDAAVQCNASVCSWFWMKHGLNSFGDNNDCDGCTRAINGPAATPASLALRAKYWQRALQVLQGADPGFLDVTGGSSST